VSVVRSKRATRVLLMLLCMAWSGCQDVGTVGEQASAQASEPVDAGPDAGDAGSGSTEDGDDGDDDESDDEEAEAEEEEAETEGEGEGEGEADGE
jgi:hypothetical protein